MKKDKKIKLSIAAYFMMQFGFFAKSQQIVGPPYFYNDGTANIRGTQVIGLPNQYLTVSSDGKSLKYIDPPAVDKTDDAFVNNSSAGRVELGTKSNGTTARTAGTEFVVQDNGSVGIGTSSPAEKVTISDATNQPILAVTNAGNAALTSLIGVKHGGVTDGYMGVDPATRNLFLLNYANGAKDMTNVGTGFVMTSPNSIGGIKIGINNTNPTTTMEVNGNAASTNTLDGITVPRLTGVQLRLKNYTSSQTGTVVYVTAADTSPGGQTVNVVTPGFYYFDGTRWIISDSTNDAFVNNSTAGRVELGTNSNGSTARTAGTEFVVQDNGNVGVGTTAPAEKLQVQGNVRFSGALMPNNNAGTAGQVLTSNGPGVAPVWTSGFVPQLVASISLLSSYNLSDGSGIATARLNKSNFSDGNFNTSTFTYTVPSAGSYRMSLTAGITLFNNNASNVMTSYAIRNNSSGTLLQSIDIGNIHNISYAGSTSAVNFYAGSAVVRANAGDRLSFSLQPCNGCLGSYRVDALEGSFEKISN